MGKASRSRRAWVERFLRAYMAELRVLLAEREPEMDARFPDRTRQCATCAFNPSTDAMQGWDTTTHHVLQAVLACAPFYCHHAMAYTPASGWVPPADKRELRLCAGFSDLIGHPDVKRGALQRAMDRVGKPPAGVAAETVPGDLA